MKAAILQKTAVANARQEKSSHAPLSLPQRFLLHRARGEAHVNRFDVLLEMRIDAATDIGALEAAFNDLIARHEILRTTFAAANGELEQVIAPASAIRPELTRIAGTEVDIVDQLATLRAQTLDTAVDLPLRGYVFKSPAACILALQSHYFAFDGWSIRPLRSDLFRAYSARADGKPVRLPDLPMQYSDYARWQLRLIGDISDPSSLAARQTAFWSAILSQPRGTCELSIGRSVPPGADASRESVPVVMGGALHGALAALARDSRTSMLMVLHAGLAAVLTSLGARPDMIIGAAVSGRNESHLNHLIGPIENVLALLSDTSGNPTFRKLLTRIRQSDLLAFANQDVPFACLMDDIMSPPFQMMLSLETAAYADRFLPQFRTTLRPAAWLQNFCFLVFRLVERRTRDGTPCGIEGEIEYERARFERQEVEKVRDQLISLLQRAVNDPDLSIETLAADGTRLVPGAKDSIFPMEVPEGATHDPQTAPSDCGFFVPASDILQDQLVKIWEEILKIQPLGVSDDFLEMGGDQERYARMLSIVKEVCGHRPRASVPSAGTTVQMLADELLGYVPSSPIIEIQAGDPESRHPLFFLHGDISGGGFYVQELARGLEADQPVFALQQHGLDGQEVPATIEEMAEEQIRRVRTVQPRGPYHLGGYCVGGMIAFEMAHRLMHQNEEVDLLIMIDMPNPDTRRPQSRPPLPSAPSAVQSPRARSFRVFAQYVKALDAYRPKWYPGKITLFRASDNRDGGREPHDSFKGFAREADVRWLPGTHASCLGRYVRAAAGEIRACLAECEKTRGLRTA